MTGIALFSFAARKDSTCMWDCNVISTDSADVMQPLETLVSRA